MSKQIHDDIQETPVPAPDPTAPVQTHKQKPGAAWKANEQHVLPENRLWLVFPGLMLCVFLAALGRCATHY